MKAALVENEDLQQLPSKPMSDAFWLQCEDAERDRHASSEVASRWKEVARKVVCTLKSAVLKHSCEYKDLEYWSRFGITHPLTAYANAINLTTSSVLLYEWISPAEVMIFDESAVHLLNNKYFVVDVFVTLPDDLFGKRDYINLIYPAKRAHYLCSSVLALRTAHKEFDVDFDMGFAGDNVFPNVKITDKTLTGCVLIHFGASDIVLAKTSRFSPNTSNLRVSTIYPNIISKDNERTPLFNQRVLRTLLESHVIRQVSAELLQKKTVISALALVNRWFSCRGLHQFDGVFLASFMAYLLSKNIVVEQQDLLTVLRNFFSAIVNWDTSSPMGFHPDDLHNDIISAHMSTFPVVFLDSTGYFNIASGISMESLLLVKADVGHSLTVLGDCLYFDALFLERHHFYSMFDHYFRLDLSPECLESIYEIPDLLVDTVDENDRVTKFTKMFIARIHECMDERFDNVYIERLQNGKFHSASFLIGFRVGRRWANPITVGPLATDPTAKEFRELWKGRTQLRKFADARICECVVWAETASLAVPYSVLQFIVANHFNMPMDCLTWRSALPTDFLSQRDVSVKIASALAGLSAVLRSAKGLPLLITNIQATSAYIRDTEPCASDVLCRSEQGTIENGHRIPVKRSIPPYAAAVTVHIKLEYSGKWGDNIDGVLHLSAAFYIEIGKYLREKHGLIAVPTRDQLFVVKDGVVFKLVLVLDKVLKILERRVAEVRFNGATQMEISFEGHRLENWKKLYVHEAHLQASLHSCSTKYFAFGETIQILKRWLSAQYMTGAIHDLALEMIVASVFECAAQPPPQTSIAAFRRVLELILKHNWAARPLLVDFDKSWNEEEVADLEANFVRMRPILPPMVIITNEDSAGARWTRDSPTPLLLKRVVGLSASMLKFLDRIYEDTKIIDIKFAFLNVDMSIYDAVIEIYPKLVVRKGASDAVNTAKNSEALPVLSFDPIQDFVCALNAHFQHAALFFWNKYGGDRIGIKWKPHEIQVPLKISRCSLHLKSDTTAGLALNKDEVLEGIRILGRGIVKKVYCNV